MIRLQQGGVRMMRIGIVGAGIIGVSHKNAIMKNSRCILAAVCDIAIEKAKKLVEGTNIPVYSDYKEMAQKEALDAVILNLPHFLHKDVAVFFLERKIAVLVEKPMANSVAECDAMIAASVESGTPLVVGHVQRYFASYRALRELIQSEKIGKLCIVTESRNIFYFAQTRPGWFWEKEKSGGGIAMNYGAHSIDKLLFTTGAEIDQVFANGNNFLNDANVEAAAQILLKLSNGVSATLSYSGCYSPYQEEVTFYFTDGVAKVCGNRELWISEKGKAFERVDLDYSINALEAQLDAFLDYLAGKTYEIATAQYGRKVISVLEEAYGQMS